MRAHSTVFALAGAMCVLAAPAGAGASELDTLPTPPDTEQTAFLGWAERRAIEEAAHLEALWTVELDGDPTPEHAARLCIDELHAIYLVEDPQTKMHWRIPHASWGHAPVCSTTTAPAWEIGHDGLVLAHHGPGQHQEVRAAIRDERLVEWARFDASSGAGFGVVQSEVRWDLRTVAGRIEDTGTNPPRTIDREGWIVAVDRGTPNLELAPAFVRSGRARWTGEHDASLRIAATRAADDGIVLHVAATDDHPIVGGTTKTERGDRVELWWAAEGTDTRDPFGERGSAQGLAVDRAHDGRVQARWLTPRAGPLPGVSGSLDRFTVTLPAASVPRDSVAWRIPFTAVLVDVDDAAGATATVVSTSRHVAGQPGSFGWLVGSRSVIAPDLGQFVAAD